jgi:hypothetical protein
VDRRRPGAHRAGGGGAGDGRAHEDLRGCPGRPRDIGGGRTDRREQPSGGRRGAEHLKCDRLAAADAGEVPAVQPAGLERAWCLNLDEAPGRPRALELLAQAARESVPDEPEVAARLDGRAAFVASRPTFLD